MLEPTAGRIEIAQRAATREWTVGPEGAIEMTTNPVLSDMVVAGLVARFYMVAYRLVRRTRVLGLWLEDDYWTLTDAGREWLARAEQESRR